MSFTTINRAFNDPQLRARVDAAVNKEAVANEDLAESTYAKQLRGDNGFVLPAFYWRVAVATEADYAYAIGAGKGAPGHDADIVTDAAITSAVVAAWPPEPLEFPS